MTADEMLKHLGDILAERTPKERTDFIRHVALLISTLDGTPNVAMEHDVPTGRITTCDHCGESIAEVRDPKTGALDWYSDGGDYGCGSSPETTDDGVGPHKPFNPAEWTAAIGEG